MHDLMFGSKYKELEEDVSRLKAIVVSIVNDMGVGGATLPEDLISEVYCFGASEIHTIGSIVGGIALQEGVNILECLKNIVLHSFWAIFGIKYHIQEF